MNMREMIREAQTLESSENLESALTVHQHRDANSCNKPKVQKHTE